MARPSLPPEGVYMNEKATPRRFEVACNVRAVSVSSRSVVESAILSRLSPVRVSSLTAE